MTEQKNTTIAIIGSPNAGKSTLINYLVGTKVSIVSPKRQTTRNIISGIFVRDNVQFVFLDTPGISEPKQRLEKFMVQNAWHGVEQADRCLFLLDSKRGISSLDKQIFERLSKINPNNPPIIALNKIDLINHNKMLELAAEIDKHQLFSEIFMISAKDGKGTDKLIEFLSDHAITGPWHYDEDDITTISNKFLAAEITREKLFLNLKEELPYSIAVNTEKWEENDKQIKIYQVIYVNKSSQKKIVIGSQGAMIKKIGQESRLELESILEKKVHLFLFVKVKEDWQDNSNILEHLD
jgi:GTP-binding protein Era